MKTALVLCCDDNFIAYASIIARRVATLTSNNFPIVIISDGVADENKHLAQKFCERITFIEISGMLDGQNFPLYGEFTRATYARLFLDQILADFDRAVYMDSDITPLVDVSPLMALVPKRAPIIATYDTVQLLTGEVFDRIGLPRTVGYLQGGVQVFDLRAVRSERIFADTIAYAHQNPEKCLSVDQDALNAILRGRWQVFDWRWNVGSLDAQFAPEPFYMRHHGGGKPWTPVKGFCEKHIHEFWRKSLSESPWPQKYAPTPLALSWKRAKRRCYYSVVDAVGMTSARRAAEKTQLASYRAKLPEYLAKIEDLSRTGALAIGLLGGP